MNTTFGNIPSPVDKRDFPLGKIQQPVIIPEVFMPVYTLPTYDQGKQPACTAHAVAWMINYNEFTDISALPILSPRFLYALSKRDDGIPNQDGTYYRQALKEAQSYGICKDSLFNNNTKLSREDYNSTAGIVPLAYEDADYRRIKSYASVGTSFGELKQAIYQNKVVLLALYVDDNMYTDSNGIVTWDESRILPLRAPKTKTNGHAVVGIGYDKDYIYFQNSWGTTWGKGGIGYIGKDYEPYVYEAWTEVDIPDADLIKLKQDLQNKLSLIQKLIDLYKQLKALLKTTPSL